MSARPADYRLTRRPAASLPARVAVVALVALALSACGDPTIADGKDGHAVTVLRRALATYDSPGSVYNAVLGAIEARSERCVREAGFPDFKTEGLQIIGQDDANLPAIEGTASDRTYRDLELYRQANMAPPGATGGEDPPGASGGDLSDERVAALTAFGGDGPPVEVELPVFGKYGYSLGGCYGQAISDVVGPKNVGRWKQSSFIVNNLGSALVGRMSADDAFSSAERRWATCMGRRGYQVKRFVEGRQQAAMRPAEEHEIANTDDECRRSTDLVAAHRAAFNKAVGETSADLEAYILDFDRINRQAAKRLGDG